MLGCQVFSLRCGEASLRLKVLSLEILEAPHVLGRALSIQSHRIDLLIVATNLSSHTPRLCLFQICQLLLR